MLWETAHSLSAKWLVKLWLQRKNHEEKWRAALVSTGVIAWQSSLIADFREYWVGPHINHFSCCCDSIPSKHTIMVWRSALPYYLKLFSITTARVWGSYHTELAVRRQRNKCWYFQGSQDLVFILFSLL